MKYRKRPVEVEEIDAWQWWPPSDGRHHTSMVSNVSAGIGPGDLFVMRGVAKHGRKDVFMLRTIKGDAVVSPGDWIILRGIGDRVLQEPELFDATYEPVEEASTEVTMGVGDGTGHLFVHGSYESIKAAQSSILRRGQQLAAATEQLKNMDEACSSAIVLIDDGSSGKARVVLDDALSLLAEPSP